MKGSDVPGHANKQMDLADPSKLTQEFNRLPVPALERGRPSEEHHRGVHTVAQAPECLNKCMWSRRPEDKAVSPCVTLLAGVALSVCGLSSHSKGSAFEKS